VEAGEGGRGDHSRVIGRKSAAREEDLDASGFTACFEGAAEQCVCSDATRNENCGGRGLFGGREGAIAKISDDGILKLADESERQR